MSTNNPGNPQRFARYVLWFYTLLTAFFGVVTVVAPVRLAATVGIVLPTTIARIDFVATYGGSVIGVAAFLAYCALHPERIRLGLIATAFYYASYALPRGTGMLLAHSEMGANAYTLYTLLAIESSGAVIALWMARKVKAPKGLSPSQPSAQSI
jgi:hypothetical protein